MRTPTVTKEIWGYTAGTHFTFHFFFFLTFCSPLLSLACLPCTRIYIDNTTDMHRCKQASTRTSTNSFLIILQGVPLTPHPSPHPSLHDNYTGGGRGSCPAGSANLILTAIHKRQTLVSHRWGSLQQFHEYLITPFHTQSHPLLSLSKRFPPLPVLAPRSNNDLSSP